MFIYIVSTALGKFKDLVPQEDPSIRAQFAEGAQPLPQMRWIYVCVFDTAGCQI